MILKKIKQKKMSNLNSGHQYGNTIHDMLFVLLLFFRKKDYTLSEIQESKHCGSWKTGRFFPLKNSFSIFFTQNI